MKHWNCKWGQTLLIAVFMKVRNILYVSACFLQGLQQHWWFPAPDSRVRAFSLLVFTMLPVIVLQDSAVHAPSWSATLAHLKPGSLCKKCSFFLPLVKSTEDNCPLLGLGEKKSAGHIRDIIHEDGGSISNKRCLKVLQEMPLKGNLKIWSRRKAFTCLEKLGNLKQESA